jgi:transcription factor SPT20
MRVWQIVVRDGSKLKIIGCLIVEVHDHKSITVARENSQTTNTVEKTEPFSIHRWNEHLTPSPWVPYPKEDTLHSTKINGVVVKDEIKSKTALEKDKENMPAPNQPVDSGRSKTGNSAKKPKISTLVLHPTPLALHVDLAIKASTPIPVPAGARRESRTDIRAATPMSASGIRPQTPLLAIPPTPHLGMEPPAKRVKREKMMLDGKNAYTAEAEITLATTAPLFLDPVDSANEASQLLDALAHPEHSSKVPSPKARKKTVAEMAAEESAAADEEQYMLILDERIPSLAGIAGAANPVDGEGQAGGASWEPRFERFKAIESIKLQNMENKKKEKIQQAEAAKRQQQEKEAREKAQMEGLKRQQDEESRRLAYQQQQQQQLIQQAQQDNHRRRMAAQAQQNQAALQGQHPQVPQNGIQHAHPAQNVMPNGLTNQQRLIQQQQFSQAQASSPIVRNATPHNLSSPMVANNLGIPMQHSNSGMGGSPPRPGSVVQQGHQQMTPAMAHAMRTQGSQQSHGGTPRLQSATPNMAQSVPRQLNQTPHMNHSSPIQGHMAQGPQMNPQIMMQNSQMANMQQFQQAQAAQAAAQAQQQQRIRAAQMAAMNGGQQQMTPQQFAVQQMHQRQQSNPQQQMMSGGQMSQQYAAQMRQMAQAQANAALQPNNPNFMGPNGMNPQMAPAPQQPMSQQQMMQAQVRKYSQNIYLQQLPQLQAQFNGQIPQDQMLAFRQSCTVKAQQYVQTQMRANQMRQAQAQAQAAGMGHMMAINPQMGMQQRPPGM